MAAALKLGVMRIEARFPSAVGPVIIVTSVTKETGFYFDKAHDPKDWIKADAIIHKELRFEQLKAELRRLMGAGENHA